MKTWIAFLRGINVGGKGLLPMKQLVSLLEGIGCRGVRTYIQSGNAVFETNETAADRLSRQIQETVKASAGFEPQVLLLTPKELGSAIAKNPYLEAESVPKSLHLFFLKEKAKRPRLEALEKLRAAMERLQRFELSGGVFYLHAPDGIGRSKLAGRVESLLGVDVTARNWNTVQAVAAVLRDA